MARKQYTRGDAWRWLSGSVLRSSEEFTAGIYSTLGRSRKGRYKDAFILITPLKVGFRLDAHNIINDALNNSKARIIRQWRTDKNQHIIFVLPRQKHDLLDGISKVNGGGDGDVS